MIFWVRQAHLRDPLDADLDIGSPRAGTPLFAIVTLG